MLACAMGDCNIDVFIRVVEAQGKAITSKCYTYMY